MYIRTLTFDIGEEAKSKTPQNYVKKLLTQHPCQFVQNILLEQDITAEQQEDTHTFWTECGHRVREKMQNDLRLELILKKVLPVYYGPNITLYRGENLERYKNQRIGFCWTKNQDIARMFAAGLNSHTTGGILLKYSFSTEQIIAAPSRHSVYLREHEYTISPSTIVFNNMSILEKYPPAFIEKTNGAHRK